MSDVSLISWTDATLNVVVGCEKVSPGCDHCYAERLVNTRQSKNPKSLRFGITFEHLTFHEDRYRMLNKRAPTRFFVNSMSDLFHHGVSESFRRVAF
jgi:protein gp37